MFAVAQPLVVTIPHRLGVAEAQRRMTEALDWFKASQGAMIKVANGAWADGSVPFHAAALGSTIPGRIDVSDTTVTVTAEVPWLLQKVIGPFTDSFVAKARDHLGS